MALQRLTLAMYCSALLLPAVLDLSLSAYAPAAARAYLNRQFGYRLTVPAGWNIAVPPSGVPVLFNYAQGSALPQGLIPDGGAEVYVIPYQAVELVTSARDLESWIAANSAMWHTNVRTSSAAPWAKDDGAPQEIVKVDADYERAPEDETLQSEVNYYFTLHHRGFRLRLLYEKGDPHGSSFNSALLAVLHSIKAL
jgi:hypothetical protein